MAKRIEFDYKDNHYILEFNRSAIANAEAQGLVFSELADKPASNLPKLFRAAFSMHHPTIKWSRCDEILEIIGNKEEMWETLAEMYSDALNSLMTSEGNEGNLTWTKSV